MQNRSHYTHEEHAQFSQLAVWTEVHKEEIKRILLDESSTAPSSTKRSILYGEWVVAKHSIKYEWLPSYFIAFDMSEDGRWSL